jgi:hypothetical protein
MIISIVLSNSGNSHVDAKAIFVVFLFVKMNVYFQIMPLLRLFGLFFIVTDL